VNGWVPELISGLIHQPTAGMCRTIWQLCQSICQQCCLAWNPFNEFYLFTVEWTRVSALNRLPMACILFVYSFVFDVKTFAWNFETAARAAEVRERNLENIAAEPQEIPQDPTNLLWPHNILQDLTRYHKISQDPTRDVICQTVACVTTSASKLYHTSSLVSWWDSTIVCKHCMIFTKSLDWLTHFSHLAHNNK
jgi:hypothetical protein